MRLKNFLRRFVKRYSLFLASVCIGALCMFMYTHIFVYKKIYINGASQTDKIKIQLAFDNKSVFLYNSSRIEKVLPTIVTSIHSVQIDIELPSTLRLNVTYKKPFATIKTDKGYVEVSEDGVVIKKGTEFDRKTPLISNNFPILHTEYQKGQRITLSTITKALQAVQALNGEGLTVESIDIDSVDMIACKTRTIEVVFSQTRDFSIQVHEMRQIVKRLKLGDLKVEAIDLRFDKPIIRTKS